MSHRQAVLGMVAVTLLWSIAGVVMRHLDSARSFEVTFWRSLFTALSLGAYYVFVHGRGTVQLLRAGGPPLWISGVMWSVMFTCFMVALTLTSVANVLVTMSVSPLLTALLAHFMLGHAVRPRTWLAIVAAGVGIAWMYGHSISGDPKHLLGTMVALGVPIAGAINWNTLQRGGASVDLLPALFIGAVISCVVTLPLALPLQATPHDIAWLAVLGIFQLALPCALAVRVARRLAAPEMSLLALLEIVFGIAWAWVGAGEQPGPHVLGGGALVLGTLAVSEAWGMRRKAVCAAP
jgi:drug/metabolite transporter (DMT)-like permease